MAKIKLHIVLAEIDQAVRVDKPHVFSLQFVRKDGTVSVKNRVRKSGSNPLRGETKGSTGFRYQVKHKGVLMLHDMDADKPFSPKISRLQKYNGIEIDHK